MDSHTHIERDRRSGSGMAFIVGGLVVAVAVIGLMFWGGGFAGGFGGGDTHVEVSTQAPAAAAPAPAVEVAPVAPAAPAN